LSGIAPPLFGRCAFIADDGSANIDIKRHAADAM
jgi:hypothetical protein